MDQSLKKRKADENGNAIAGVPSPDLTVDDCRKIIDSFTADQLRDIVAGTMVRDHGVLAAVRAVADHDQTQRKLFIRGLGWETTNDSLRSIFSAFGDLEEAVVIMDKNTGKSKGYGFITFRHIDGAILALKDPSKKIDGRMTVAQLAVPGNSAGAVSVPAVDVSLRKIYVANVPAEMSSDRLLHLFASFGEIEEGPLGFDKQTGKFRGFALFVYKTAEAARACLVVPNKMIDGQNLVCKLAIDGKKGKGGGGQGQGQGMGGGDGMGIGGQVSMSNQYGGPGASMGSFGGFSGGPGPIGHHHNVNSSNLGSGAPGLSSGGGQVHGGNGGGGYGAGLGGPYGSAAQYGGVGTGGFGGFGMGSYRMPPNSGGMASGGYGEGGHYPTGGYQNQHHQQTGSSPVPRVPSGGMYQNIQPFY